MRLGVETNINSLIVYIITEMNAQERAYAETQGINNFKGEVIRAHIIGKGAWVSIRHTPGLTSKYNQVPWCGI